MLYKDHDNNIYDDMGGSALLLPSWPQDITPITAEEAAILRQAAIDATPVVVPSQITMRQTRLGLLAIGKLADIETAISGLGEAEQIEWQYAQTVKFNHPVVVDLLPLLGLTDTEIDELFLSSSKL